MVVFYVISWHPFFTLIFTFCPIDCSRGYPQEKAKEVKAGSEMKVL